MLQQLPLPACCLADSNTIQQISERMLAIGAHACTILDESGHPSGVITFRHLVSAIATGADPLTMPARRVLEMESDAAWTLPSGTGEAPAESADFPAPPLSLLEEALATRIDPCGDQLGAYTLQLLLDDAYEGYLIVDSEGIVRLLNRAFEQMINFRREAAVGRHCTEVVPNTRMHIVVKTGVAEVGWRERIHDYEMVVQRVPIRRDGRVIGAYAKVMYLDWDDIQRLVLRVRGGSAQPGRVPPGAEARYTFDSIVGASQALLGVKQLAVRAARSSANVLLLGETGTGKELFAHAIHQASSRRSSAFVSVNCSAIPADLLEAELFGYEDGAFTGARKGGKPGKFELASGGTLFLDEIGEMPMHMQAKLLRALQEREIERIGGEGPRRVDLRFVAATNADLKRQCEEGRFRWDLYFRLNVVQLEIPPLRERGDDISALVAYYLYRMQLRDDVTVRFISEEALDCLRAYPWPGNVRELANLLERMAYTLDHPTILLVDLPEEIRRYAPTRPFALPLPAPRPPEPPAAIEPTRFSLRRVSRQAEREQLIRALEAAGGSRMRAAELLGIHRVTLFKKLREHGLQ